MPMRRSFLLAALVGLSLLPAVAVRAADALPAQAGPLSAFGDPGRFAPPARQGLPVYKVSVRRTDASFEADMDAVLSYWAPVYLRNVRGYVQALTVRDGVPGVTVTPGEVTTGTETAVRVMKAVGDAPDTVRLDLDYRFSQLVGPDAGFRNWGSEIGTIQLPEIRNVAAIRNGLVVKLGSPTVVEVGDGSRLELTVTESGRY